MKTKQIIIVGEKIKAKKSPKHPTPKHGRTAIWQWGEAVNGADIQVSGGGCGNEGSCMCWGNHTLSKQEKELEILSPA